LYFFFSMFGDASLLDQLDDLGWEVAGDMGVLDLGWEVDAGDMGVLKSSITVRISLLKGATD
jgi:hypothetical protein